MMKEGIKNVKEKGMKYAVSFFSFIMMNYDLMYFIMNVISFNTMFCRWIEVEISSGTREGENFLDSSFETDFSFSSNSEFKSYMMPLHVSYVNDNIKCYGNHYYITLFLGIALVVANQLIKLISFKLMKFTPSPNVFGCKYGNLDLTMDVALNFILFSKTLTLIIFADNYDIIRYFYYVYLAILIVAYLVIFFCKPYYNDYYFKLRSFQLLYLINLTFISILVRETNLKWVKSEPSSIIFIMISMTLMLKVNNNLSRESLDDFFSKIKDFRNCDNKTIL